MVATAGMVVTGVAIMGGAGGVGEDGAGLPSININIRRRYPYYGYGYYPYYRYGYYRPYYGYYRPYYYRRHYAYYRRYRHYRRWHNARHHW